MELGELRPAQAAGVVGCQQGGALVGGEAEPAALVGFDNGIVRVSHSGSYYDRYAPARDKYHTVLRTTLIPQRTQPTMKAWQSRHNIRDVNLVKRHDDNSAINTYSDSSTLGSGSRFTISSTTREPKAGYPQ